MSDEPSRLEPPKWPVERVLEWIDEGCVLFDRRLDVVYANEPGSALFGLAPAQLVGRNLHSQFPAPIASEFQRAALPVVGAGTSAHATLHDETTGRWLDATMYPSSDGLLALFADVTSDARKELEQAAHTDYLQQLVDQIPAFLWIIDRDLIVRRIEGGRPMLQALDRDRLVGLHMAEVTQMGAIDGRWRAWPASIARRGRGSPSKRTFVRCAIATAPATSSVLSASGST
jgi:PAS domain-containing protein